MAKPIKETPVLRGQDARRFLAETRSPKTISKEDSKKQKETFELFKSISSFNW